MADLVLSLGQILLSTISKAKELWQNRTQNVEVLQELTHFMKDLQLNILTLQNKCISVRCSNTTTVALDALRMDLEGANAEAKTILNEGFLRSLWNANKTLEQLQRLHKRVMTSFQTKLTIATFDVTIDTKQGLDSFKESMAKVNAKLLELYSANSDPSAKRIENIVREELQKAFQPLKVALEKSNGGVEAAVSMICNTDPQTSETEKFFADVLEGLKHNNRTWYEDPITWETMCDPVKGTDGYTYDRWTFLRHASSMTRSPFLGDVQTPFHIAMDDVSVRIRLFNEFPEQEEKCTVQRASYKEEALQTAHTKPLGEALIMLNSVLMWDPQDEECCSKRDDIQQQIVANSLSDLSFAETSQQATSSRSQNHLRALEDSNYGLEEPSCVEAVLFTDKLTAAYLIYNSANVPKHVLLHANLPCPSDSYPFYYFEMIVQPPVVSYDNDPNRTNVAIGFSCTKAMGESSHDEQLPQLGMYPASCGYYSANGEICYYDKEKSQVVSIESEAFQAGDTVGAGFHSRTGNVFFTRCGQVVTFVKAAIFEHPIGTIFPFVGLQSYGAQVKLNFGHSPYKFLNEPYPTRLNRTTCDENHLVLSPNGISLKTKANRGTFRAILADKPVPVRTTLFYFEVCIENFLVLRHGCVALGFTGTDGFQQEGSPGNWKNSCGYHNNHEESFILVSQGTGLKSKTSLGRIGGWHNAAHIHYRIGAGIHYDSNEFFFVKNGVFIGAVSNTLTGKLMPALAVRNNYKMEVKFGSCVNTCLEICKPSGFKFSSRLQTLKHTAFPKDKLRFKKHLMSRGSRSESGIIAFQADNVAPFHQEDFYFELTVNNSGNCGNITIGFCHHSHFRDDMQPGGYPHSCGYHGATGMLFTGSETGQEFGPTFSKGDTVGAGISFNTNMIFFVKNGKVIESIPNEMMSCALYPVVSLGSVGDEVHFNFGKHPFLC